MSGIGAIFNLDRSDIPSGSAERMANALQLYGPLKKISRTAGNFAFAWTQAGLFTLQDRYDQQPVGMGGRCCLLFSGFLVQRDDLGKKLGIDPQRLKYLADSALAHAAWQKWGRKITLHMKGQFAVILADYDAQLLYAFRSAGAAVPLFYYRSSGRIVIASAPKGIFALGDISRELNEERLADSIVNNHEHIDQSYYRDILSVPMGQMLTIGSDRFSVKPIEKQTIPDIRFASNGDYVERAMELLARSIACHMRSVTTPAATLSSGFDSSAVVVGALDYLGRQDQTSAEPLISFTSIPASGWDGRASGLRRVGDESGPVRALANMYPQLDARFVDSAGLSIEHDLDKLILLAEAPPLAINNMHWIMNIYRHAREAGRNVILNGVSGNRTFSGSGRARYAELLKQGRLLKLARELRKSDNRGTSFWGVYGRAIMPNLPASVVKTISRIRRDPRHAGWNSFSAAREDYVRDMRVNERAEETRWDDSYRGDVNVRDQLETMGTNGSRDSTQSLRYALQALTGVQARDPLGDQDIVDYCIGLPASQFLQNGMDRSLIKRMMAGRLPPEIMNADRGRQAADWHMRITRDLPQYREEIERMGDDGDISGRFDIPRLKKLLDNWPDKTPISAKDHPDIMLAQLGLTRAISTSRFINWVKGKN